MLGEPALGLAEVAADAQREALLAEEDIAAVAGADAPDRVVLREVADVAALRVAIERRVQAAVEVVDVLARVEHLEGLAAHARHDAHVEDDVDAVGQLEADLRELRALWPHDVRHDVHRAALHRAVEQLADLRVGLGGVHPVVGGARLVLGGRADEGEVLDARDVVRVRAVQVAARELLLVERLEDLQLHRLGGELLLLLVGTVAPHDVIGLREGGHLGDPLDEMRVAGEDLTASIHGVAGRRHRAALPQVQRGRKAAIAGKS